MTKSKRTLPTQGNWLKTTVIIVILAILGLLALKFVYNRQQPPLPEEWKIPQAKNPDSSHASAVEQPSATPTDLSNHQTVEAVKTPLTPCMKTSEEISSFYKHLEEQEYIKAYEIQEPIGDYINKIVIKLLNNPPVIAAETNNLLTVLKNTAHFYRVLGPKDISLIKDILTYENDDLEVLMATFYRWSQQQNCKSSTTLQLPLKKMYEHAAFFLNTLGGQSYLFRRDSRLRILTRYYCTLIVDQANKENINKYNLDSANIVRSVLQEVTSTEVLEDQDLYIKTLNNLGHSTAQ